MAARRVTPLGETGQNGHYTIAAVERAILLLEVLGRLGPTSLTTLAQEANCSRAAAFRLMRTLNKRGFAIQDGPRGNWRLGNRLIALGRGADDTDAVAATAAAHLRTLARISGEPAYLLARKGLEAEIVAIHLPTPQTLHLGIPSGRRPLHAGAGRLLLAFAPEIVQVQLLATTLPRYTPVTITDPRRIAADLVRVRERGWLITESESETGTVSINAPIRDEAGQVPACVTIFGPALRLRGRRGTELVTLVQEAAADISRDLGWEPPGGGKASSHPATKNRRATK